MAGTEKANGTQGTYNVTSQSSAYVKAPNSGAKGMKPQVNKGGDLRSKGSK